MQQISVSVASSILEISSEDWDACGIDATGNEHFNPFTTHAFLSSLEESGCSTKVGLRSTKLFLLQNICFFFFFSNYRNLTCRRRGGSHNTLSPETKREMF